MVIGMPLAFMTIPNAGLPIFILLMGMIFVANQLTPTHICLSATAEYFHISFEALIRKTLPVTLILTATLILYYLILSVFL